MSKIRVFITDDHFIVREGIRLILETVDYIEVVGEAADGADCLQQVATVRPDVVLIDLQMPRMDGLTALTQLRQDYPEIAVVILTTYNEDEMMLKGLQAGAQGYLLKDTDRETLLDTIVAAAKGETLLKPEILQRVLAAQTAVQNDRTSGRTQASTADQRLTAREAEVMVLVAQGERNKEIAQTLKISARTVKAHLTSVYNKLGVDSRAAAVSKLAQT